MMRHVKNLSLAVVSIRGTLIIPPGTISKELVDVKNRGIQRLIAGGALEVIEPKKTEQGRSDDSGSRESSGASNGVGTVVTEEITATTDPKGDGAEPDPAATNSTPKNRRS